MAMLNNQVVNISAIFGKAIESKHPKPSNQVLVAVLQGIHSELVPTVLCPILGSGRNDLHMWDMNGIL